MLNDLAAATLMEEFAIALKLRSFWLIIIFCIGNKLQMKSAKYFP
ncbi:hypothetical protein [Scytonema sp. UIC 10036]|nr:hypothetical protein [Scytonema sp. UIC 10036]